MDNLLIHLEHCNIRISFDSVRVITHQLEIGSLDSLGTENKKCIHNFREEMIGKWPFERP
jgi:hypothetical protein